MAVGDHYIAPGTPFQRPKIANSIVELIGATPMVKHISFKSFFKVQCDAGPIESAW